MYTSLTVEDDIIVPVRQFTTPMTNPTNPPAVSSTSSEQLSAGAIAGIVIGIVISILIVIVIIVAIRFVTFTCNSSSITTHSLATDHYDNYSVGLSVVHQ